MPVARARSRLVKLILAMPSMIGRASKPRMSMCSTAVDSNSALRVSLIAVADMIVSSSSGWLDADGIARGWVIQRRTGQTFVISAQAGMMIRYDDRASRPDVTACVGAAIA